MQYRTVRLVEVGLRDGLQSEPQVISTSEKVELIKELIGAGLRRLEVASFVSERRVPQMADAEALMAALPKFTGCIYIGLALNLRGAERALAAGIDEIGTAVPASDTFGLRNQGQTSAEALQEVRRIITRAGPQGTPVHSSLSMAFGCPFETQVPEARVIDLARQLADLGVREIGLADTIGVAVPAQVTELFGRLREEIPHVSMRAHFHDTRNTGIANVWAAIEAGAEAVDASIGGLGGCPFASGASGNVATEDVAYLLERSGLTLDLDLHRLIEIARRTNELFDRTASRGLLRAGLPNNRRY